VPSFAIHSFIICIEIFLENLKFKKLLGVVEVVDVPAFLFDVARVVGVGVVVVKLLPPSFFGISPPQMTP
jgi:hypothetical protein